MAGLERRVAALEAATAADRPHVVWLVALDEDDADLIPSRISAAFHDRVWHRQPGESWEAFRARVEADAKQEGAFLILQEIVDVATSQN
jgi:hypothetical protein